MRRGCSNERGRCRVGRETHVGVRQPSSSGTGRGVTAVGTATLRRGRGAREAAELEEGRDHGGAWGPRVDFDGSPQR